MNNKFKDILSKLSNEKKTINNSILLIDGMNTFIRSFTMVNSLNVNGHHIGGLVGFLKSIGYAIKQLSPTRVIIVFDGVNSSLARKNLYPEYKSHRGNNRITNYSIFSSLEEEKIAIEQQMARLIPYLQCLPVDLICIDGLEADDVIGFLSQHFEHQDDVKETYIISSDQDYMQLVSDKIKIYSPIKRKIYTKDTIKDEYNVSSNNFIIMKCLIGDMGDNIPGIKGLGPVKLKKYYPQLINDETYNINEIIQYSEDIINNTEYNKKNINERKIYDKVIENKNQLLINNQLMNLKEVPLSNENENEIIKVFDNPNRELNKHNFLIMYYADYLGENIPNVESWVELVFRNLSFK